MRSFDTDMSFYGRENYKLNQAQLGNHLDREVNGSNLIIVWGTALGNILCCSCQEIINFLSYLENFKSIRMEQGLGP